MANWDSYTQKSTPADNDTLMIKDTSGSANKRSLERIGSMNVIGLKLRKKMQKQ